MTSQIKLRVQSQRGMTLIELMVSLLIGMLVVLAAMGSLMMTNTSSRASTNSAALEQTATLAMMQISQQISQAGSIVANSNTGSVVGSSLPYITFDTSALGGVNSASPMVSIYGVDGGTNPDTLVFSYTAPNDMTNSIVNCIGKAPEAITGSLQQRVINHFTINSSTNNLVCNGDATVPTTATLVPIASNVLDLKVNYVLVDGVTRNVTVQKATSGLNWNQVVGVQVCLEMRGDPSQAPAQTFNDCRGNNKTVNDGSVHRVISQTFYLRNINA